MKEKLPNSVSSGAKEFLNDKHWEKVEEGSKEIVHSENLPFLKPMDVILKNHYGENLTPIEVNKDEYTIRELVDRGWLKDNQEFKYDDQIYFDIPSAEESSKYYKNSESIIKVSEDSIQSLNGYWDSRGTRMHFEDITEKLINIKDIPDEILNLIPEDFGTYTFQGKSPYSNSLYFQGRNGKMCRISDHRLGEHNTYTNFMVYNIIVGEEENTKIDE